MRSSSLRSFTQRPAGRETATAGRRRFLASLSGRRPAAEGGDYWIRVHRTAMACRFEITFAAQDGAAVPAASAALDGIDRLERELSLFRETSAIAELNRSAASGPVRAAPYLVDLLDECRRVHRETGGAFDVTSTPLSRCWGFLRRQGRVPDPEAIETARALVGFDAVQLDREQNTVRFTRPGIELNLGAIGKGFALDRAAAEMRTAGAAHALLSAGGSSFVALGGRGDGWRIDLVSPRVSGRPIATLQLRNAALGTSGAGEQFVVADGRRYGHVIDPRTGWPAIGVLSASVVASDAATADALSTAFLVGGADLARRYCAEHLDVLALVTPEGGSTAPLVFGSHRAAQVVKD